MQADEIAKAQLRWHIVFTGFSFKQATLAPIHFNAVKISIMLVKIYLAYLQIFHFLLGHFRQLLNNTIYHGSHQFCRFLIDALK